MNNLVLALLAGAAILALPQGSWTQASETTELVITSKIKLTPSGGSYWGGTSLGGSVGIGSATTTRVVSEPVPTKVRRTMDLGIQGDGSFRWKIARSYVDAQGCTRRTEQQKAGKATIESGELVFRISGGNEQTSGCGASGSKPLAASTERYAAVQEGNTLTLSGVGGVRWKFTR